jgi:hypothetical protein
VKKVSTLDIILGVHRIFGKTINLATLESIGSIGSIGSTGSTGIMLLAAEGCGKLRKAAESCGRLRKAAEGCGCCGDYGRLYGWHGNETREEV